MQVAIVLIRFLMVIIDKNFVQKLQNIILKTLSYITPRKMYGYPNIVTLDWPKDTFFCLEQI